MFLFCFYLTCVTRLYIYVVSVGVIVCCTNITDVGLTQFHCKRFFRSNVFIELSGKSRMPLRLCPIVELFNTGPTYYLIPPMVVNGLVQAAHGLFNHHVIEKQRQNKIVVYAIFTNK